MFVKATIPAQGLNYIKVEACDPNDKDAVIPTKATDESGKHPMKDVENEVYKIFYKGQDNLDRATFSLYDKVSSKQTQQFFFSLKYYDPYVEDGADSSGAYIFKYDTKTEEGKQKRQYSKFEKFEIY